MFRKIIILCNFKRIIRSTFFGQGTKKKPDPIKIKLKELKEMSKEQLIDLILKQFIIPTPTCRPEYKFKTRISKR